MATEKIFIQIDDEVIELKGADKEAFLEKRAEQQAQEEALKAEQQAQKQLKKDAYTKLGLTEKEINAIL